MPYLSTFRPEFEKNILSYLKSATSNLSKSMFHVQEIKLSLEPKLSYLGTFWPEFEAIVIFQINTLKFFKMQSFT